ncbi:RecE family exodeoxyribonuclease [Erwinia sp. OPT-41]|uniref:RecE family exodeoxyribonuclease n=1 Tax=Erwinia plantamica TaxID=3237104 RepID=A0ABW7CL67_9GAMM
MQYLRRSVETNKMPAYSYFLKAKQKFDKKSLFIHFDAKDDKAALNKIAYLMDESDLDDAHYFKPVRTDFPVVDDLPPENVFDDTWCDRYELVGKTWQPIPGPAETVKINAGAPAAGEPAELPTAQPVNVPAASDVAAAPAVAEPAPAAAESDDDIICTADGATLVQRVLGAWLYKNFRGLTRQQGREIHRLQHDTDATYPQNLLLAVNSSSVRQLQHVFPETIFMLVTAVKSIWPAAGKAPTVGLLLQFIEEWLNAHNDAAGAGAGRDKIRADVVAKWVKRYNKPVIEHRTSSGTNAGGGNVTDRGENFKHDFDTLALEVAIGIVGRAMDFDIYNLRGGVINRARDIVKLKEKPFPAWFDALRSSAGILDYSRAAIIALVKCAPDDVHNNPIALREYINRNLTESDHAHPTPETIAAACGTLPAEGTHNENEEGQEHQNTDRVLADAAQPAEPVSGTTDEHEAVAEALADPVSVDSETTSNEGEKEEVTSSSPEVFAPLGSGKYDVSALFAGSPLAGTTIKPEAAEIIPEQPITEPESAQTVPEPDEPEPAAPAPAYFEPGRYADLPNAVYHAANGISSTMLKDARVSLLWYHGRHVAKTIPREATSTLNFGNLVHTLALQPEKLAAEFNIEPVIPAGAFTTIASMKKAIEAYNAAIPPGLSIDDIKARIEAYNNGQKKPHPLSCDATETGMLYGMLPPEFQTIPDDQKHTVAAMKAAIKQYNSTLPAQLKTSGGRDELLSVLETIEPQIVAAERQRPQPVNTSGNKEELTAIVKKIRPDAVFADELIDAWKSCDDGRIPVTQKQMRHAKALQAALLAHPTIGPLLSHPDRESEVSYFGIDDGTGLEVRVRPDIEITTGGRRIGMDLKTISMWGVKQDQVKGRLHREIIARDYHLSAAMYSDVAGFDQFFWIFINADENYAWVAIVEASPDLLDLGRLEYKKTLRDIDDALSTGQWPAPITDDYTDELNDYDLRRLEALREAYGEML